MDCTLKSLSYEETETETNKSHRGTAGFHKAQRLAVFAQFLKEGEVREQISLRKSGFHKG